MAAGGGRDNRRAEDQEADRAPAGRVPPADPPIMSAPSVLYDPRLEPDPSKDDSVQLFLAGMCDSAEPPVHSANRAKCCILANPHTPDNGAYLSQSAVVYTMLGAGYTFWRTGPPGHQAVLTPARSARHAVQHALCLAGDWIVTRYGEARQSRHFWATEITW